MPGLYEALLGARSAKPGQPMATPPPPMPPQGAGGDPLIIDPVSNEEAIQQGIPPIYKPLDIQPIPRYTPQPHDPMSFNAEPSLYQALAFGRKRSEPPQEPEEDPWQKANKGLTQPPGSPGAAALAKKFAS